MPSAEESAELRMLQAKAYGPGGGLTAAELERLRELEAGGQPAADPQAEPPEQRTASNAQHETPGETVPVDDAAEEAEQTEEAEPSTGIHRRRWPLIAAASAVLVAIGVGVGWSVWGQQNRSIALTDEQRSWQEELLSEDEYDPGSVVAVREQEGIVVWAATRKSGQETCALLSNGVESSASCRDTDLVKKEGVWSELATLDDPEPDTTTFWQVTMLFSWDGRPAATLNNYAVTSGGDPLYKSDREQEIADALIAQGFTQSRLWIAGYYDDVPVWVGTPMSSPDESCLIYVDEADAMLQDCGQYGEGEDPLALTIVDTEGETPRAVTMSYGLSLGMPTNLTITIRPASDVVVDTQTGDVIDVTTADPES